MKTIMDAIKAIPQYTKDHLSEGVVYSAVGLTASIVALKCFGRFEAIGAAAIISLTYYYRDKICLIYASVQSRQFLVLIGATASLPFIASVPFIGIKLAIPIAASLALAFLHYEMRQRETIKRLENINTRLTQNNAELDKRIKAYDQITSSAKEILENQIRNNASFTNLHTTMVENGSKLEAIAQQDANTANHLNTALKLFCEMLAQCEKTDLAEDITEASLLMTRVHVADAKLGGLEKQVEAGFEEVSEMERRLKEAQQRLDALKRNKQQPKTTGEIK